ncbi:MAG: hypothetical protein ABIP51_19115 [Bacteroidia bacterium]
MLNKLFFSGFIFIVALFFPFQRSTANDTTCSKYKILKTISEIPVQATNQTADLIINLDDEDDEACSKGYKLLKYAITLNSDFNSLTHLFCLIKMKVVKSTHIPSLVYKTSISISICCIKI